MNQITMKGKRIPVIGEYDVAVVGGGTAGAVAAISCGMEGLKTLIIEQFGALGGSQTMAMVTPMMSSRIPDNNGACSISSEISKRTGELGFAASIGDGINAWFDPTMLKIVLEEKLAKAEEKLALAEDNLRFTQIELTTVYKSYSWKITLPLRKLRQWLRI